MRLAFRVRAFAAVVCLVGISPLPAFHPPQEEPLPSVDRRREAARQLARAALAAPQPEAPPAPAAPAGLRVTWDDLLETPKFILPEHGFLTGEHGQPPASGERGLVRAAPAPPADPHAPVKAFLNRQAGWLGHGAEILESARVEREYVTPHNGQRTVVWQQQVDGLDVFGARLIAHLTKRHELAALSSQVLPQAAKKAPAGSRQQALNGRPLISSERALALAAEDVGEAVAQSGAVTVEMENPVQPDLRQHLHSPWSRGAAWARLVWLPMHKRELRLAWEVVFYARSSGHLFRSVVDAGTGEVWVRHNLTKNDAEPASFRVFTDRSPRPLSPGWATPSTLEPDPVPRQLVTLVALNTNASPLGWINPGGTETLGNNVAAHTDWNGDNQPDLPRPAAPDRIFDFPLDLSGHPTNSASAAVVNLFYWCNFAHDRFYELGFTEMLGNFQQTNFNRGGLGGDPVLADAQDGEGFNNANFSTPPYDGMSPRMQMYLFSAPHPDRDGSLDAEVILHEYTHGLSERLVGSGYGIVDSQASGLAEGWSDFMAMSLLSTPEQNPGGNFPFSAYVARMFGGILAENYYYGLRRYPYSTNLGVAPLTFKDIDPTQASLHLGVPRNPAIGTSASQVHNQGEVWCSMLWDMRANLIARHGFATGNWLAMQLVVDGMRNCPANPNFINARDAILLADRISNGGANRAEIWAAFARRGLGAMASSPPSYTTIGVVEDFSLPEDFDISPNSTLTINGTVGGPFTPASVAYDLLNAGRQPLTWTASASALLKLSATNGVLGAEAATRLTVSLASIATELPAGTYTQQVVFANTLSGSNQVRTIHLVIREQASFLVEFFDHTDFDLEYTTLTFTPDGSPAGYSLCRQPASAFPTDPTDGERIDLGDDWYVPKGLTNGATVSLFGMRTNILYISSNGHLTTRMGNTQYFQPELAVFYEQPRVAALYADLHPGQTNLFTGALDARVSWRQLEDRVAVTWQDVPEYGIHNSNSFQIEMFFNGIIRMTWLRIDARNGRVGLAAGRGVPSGLVETDLSGAPLCGQQLTLWVQEGLEGQGTIAGGGWVSIPAPQLAEVEVTLLSENTNEVVLPSTVVIPPGQTSQWFAVTFPDDRLLDGPRRTRVHATAPGFSAGQTLVRVLDDETAELSLVFPQPVMEGAGLVAQAGMLRVTPPPDEALLVSLSSGNPALAQIPLPGMVIVGAGQAEVPLAIRVLDNSTIEGLSAVAIQAAVAGWPLASAILPVLDNESRQLALHVPGQVGEKFGTLTNAGRVSVVGPLTFDLVVVLQSSQPARVIVPSAVTIPMGQSSASFDIQIVDDTFINPDNQALLTASAPGFTNAAALLTITDDESLPVPQLLEPPAPATNVAHTPVLRWASGFGELLRNGGFESGDFTGWSNQASPDGSAFIINRGLLPTAQGAGPFAPLAGTFEALSHPLSAGRRELVQILDLPAAPGVLTLSWQHCIRNYAEAFSDRHQYRVEIRQAGDGQLLAMPFRTQAGDPLLQEPAPHAFDLSPWRGQRIEVAFVVEDSLGCLNVSVDEVSVRLESEQPLHFEVYLGTTSNLGPAQLLGTTTNHFWAVTNALAPNTRHFWRVVARRGGESNASPIGTFTTTGNAPLPVVALLQPADYATITAPTNLTLTATATSPAGVIKVSYYDGANLVGEAATPPYAVAYALNAAGLRQLRAVMLDAAGKITESRPAHVIAISGGDQPITFVPAGAPWRYLDDGSNQGAAWRQRDFDDSAWKTGRGRFGYGLGGETTVLDFGPDPENKYVTTYFRTVFTNEAQLSSLTLRLVCDDGAVLWFNDQPIRINMPAYSVISFNDRAETEVTGPNQTNFVTYNLHPWVLPRGPVWLAVEVHQHTNNGPDLAFDLALEGSGNYLPVVALTQPAAGAVVPAGQPVALQAAAFDRYGRVERVEFFADDQKLGESHAPPYTLLWTNPPPGVHQIMARARDNVGAESATLPTWIAVGGPRLGMPALAEQGLHLGWPGAPGEFQLEMATRLDPPDWRPVTNPPTGANGLQQLLLPFEGAQRFFRLRAP